MKGGTSSSNQGQHTTTKTEKQSPQGKYQPTAEQVRFSQLLNEDEPQEVQDKIQKVIEMTQKPHDEVSIALHDCDYSVEMAVNNLLEGKYDQGEWTTFQSRKKKSTPVDVISPVNPKDKTGNSRQDRKENRDSGGGSQSVEYNNRRNKGQLDRISDGNSSRQNGPLNNNTRPPGGGRNRNREDRDDQDDQRGDREDRREERRGDNRRDRGGDRGEQTSSRKNRNDYRDRDRNDRGSRGGRSDREDRWDKNEQNDRGDRGGNRGDRGGDRGERGGDRGDRGDRGGDRGERGGDRGDRGGDRGERGGDRGDRGGDRGDRGGDRGERGGDRGDRGGERGERGGDRGERWNSGDRSGDRGDRRYGGRGGFNRRGGMNRGGRGGRGSRGGRFPNNRSGGRRSDQTNGPSKDNEFSTTTESWDVSPDKEEKDWAASEPTGTTEDWGAEEWGNDKKDDTNTPSWATTDEKTSTWETADVPTSQNLTNHVNHLPECDDEAILSSKVASKSSSRLNSNYDDTIKALTDPIDTSQSYSLDTTKSFGLSSNVSSTPPKESGIAALANAGLTKMTNHHSPSMDRVHTSTSQVTTSQQPPVAMTTDSDQPQPQRQQKTRTKRVPKPQVPKQAVEMPGNNGGMDSLDVQFGNLEFGGDLVTGSKPEEVRVLKQKEESIPMSTAGNVSISQQAPLNAVVTTASTAVPKPVTIATTSMTSESAVVNTYEQMSPRHYQPPSTPASKSAMTQMTPEPSPRKEKPVDLREPKTPPMTKKVDVSTSPMPLSTTITASIAKTNNEVAASRGTSLHSQIEAIATSDERLEERVHQQAPPIGHSAAPHSDQNTMRSRLPGVDVTSSSATRPNPTPAGVSLSSSGTAGPPPGIISGIQPTSTGPPKTTSTNASRQTTHGTKPPNLPPGVMPLYGMQPAPGFAGFSPLAYPLEDMQMIQRMQMQPPYHYDMPPFPVSGREGVQNSYSGTDVKYNRNDTSSPVPSTLTAGPHGQQAPFINTHAPIHPFGYPSNLAFYHGGGMIGGFATPYTTQMYQLPTKGPGVTTQFQQNFANQLGPHYTSGYDGLSNAHDFGKQGYQTQSKANPVSGSTASNSASDLSTAYKPQFTDKGYLSGTPPPLNISLPGQAHQPHPAGFPLMPVLAPTQHPPSLFPSHHLSHQQQLDNLNQNRGAQNQGKVTQSKSHHGQSIYPPPFWSGTN